MTADIHTREPRCDFDSTSNIHIPVDGNGKLYEKTRFFNGIRIESSPSEICIFFTYDNNLLIDAKTIGPPLGSPILSSENANPSRPTYSQGSIWNVWNNTLKHLEHFSSDE